MIASKAHPQHPGDADRPVFVALWFDRQSGEWRPLADQDFDTEIEAARVCVTAFQRDWGDIEADARMLRALCEHPNFAEFSEDGIDASMIRNAAQRVAERIETSNANVARLLDGPGDGDVILIDAERFEVNPATGLLEPLAKSEPAEHGGNSDALFLRKIEASLDEIKGITGHSVSPQGMEDAIVMLVLMLPEDADEPGPEQFAADRLFGRFVAASLRKVFERTGQQVSDRGLRDVIRMIERVLEDRSAPANGNSESEDGNNGGDA